MSQNAIATVPSFSQLLEVARAEKSKTLTVMNGVYDAVVNSAGSKSKITIDVPCGAKVADSGKVSLVYVKFPIKAGKKDTSNPLSETEDITLDVQACIDRLARMPEVNPTLPKREEGENTVVSCKPNMQGYVAASLAAFFSGRRLPDSIKDETFLTVMRKAIKTDPDGVNGVIPEHLERHLSAFLEARMTPAQLADKRAAEKAAADKRAAEKAAAEKAAAEKAAAEKAAADAQATADKTAPADKGKGKGK